MTAPEPSPACASSRLALVAAAFPPLYGVPTRRVGKAGAFSCFGNSAYSIRGQARTQARRLETTHDSRTTRLDSRPLSNRQIPELETLLTRRKQTPIPLRNRQDLGKSAIQLRSPSTASQGVSPADLDAHFYSTVMLSRKRRNPMKTKDRCTLYSTVNRGGSEAIFSRPAASFRIISGFLSPKEPRV